MKLRSYASSLNKYFERKVYYFRNKNRLLLTSSTYNELSKYQKGFRQLQSVNFNNHRICFSAPFWFLHSLDEIFVQEVYKFYSEKKEPVIIDCGANIGLSILYFKNLYENARIIAFEADPLVFDQLNKNLIEYNYNNIKLVNAAVWNKKDKIIFNSEGSVGGKISFDESKDKNSVEVPTIRLREYLHTEIDFLKIDIEGAEYQVLKDCADLLYNVNNLFIEYHVLPNESQHLHDILSWVNSAGFKYYIKEAWENMTYPFIKSYNDHYQMQLNIFCYR